MKFLIILTLITSLHPTVTARERDDLDRRIGASFGERASDEDLAWMTEEIRPIVIERLLEKVNALRAINRYGVCYEEELLVRMGHLETIERIVEEMNQPGRFSSVEETGTEIAIPYLMPMVYTASTEVQQIAVDVTHVPVRTRYARCVMDIVARREVFPAATREWAEHMRGNIAVTPPEGRIDLLKKWWEKNQTAIIEKRYADATWLPALYKGKPSYFSDEEIKDRKADQERQRLVRQAKRNDATPAVSEPPNASSRQTLWGALGVLGLLLVGWAGWRFKTRTSR